MKKRKSKGSIGEVIFILCVLYFCIAIFSYESNNDSKSSVTNYKSSATHRTFPSNTPKATSTKAIPTKIVTFRACVKSSGINIRQNPGTNTQVIGGLASGDCIEVIGRNPDASWVNIITKQNSKGWVAAWLMNIEGNIKDLPIVSSIIPPTAPPNVQANPSSNNKDNKNNCHPAYTSVCIPTGRGDLDCKDIPFRNFAVSGSDPYNFDGDFDGRGCEG